MKIEIEIDRKSMNVAKAVFLAVCEKDEEMEAVEKFFAENADETLGVSLKDVEVDKSVQLQLGLLAMAMADKLGGDMGEAFKNAL